MRIFRTNSAVKNTKHYAFTQKFPLTTYSGKHHDWPPATYLCRYRHPVQLRLPELGGMDDLRKRYEKTPPPSFLSGEPFKRPFGNKDKPSLIYLCFPNGLYFSDDLLKHAAANNGLKSKSTPPPFPLRNNGSQNILFLFCFAVFRRPLAAVFQRPFNHRLAQSIQAQTFRNRNIHADGASRIVP